ncbi:hypothetical protein [Roseovarius sp. MMSF_3305]|nr:hypothetical protein [Roseovarius sp. MMSF_3305]
MSKINSYNCSIYPYANHKRRVAGIGVMSSQKGMRAKLLKGVKEPALAENCASDVAENFCDSELLAFANAVMTTGGPVTPAGKAFYNILSAAGLVSGGGNATTSSDLLAGGGGAVLGGKVGNWVTGGSTLGTLGGIGAGALGGIALNNTHQAHKACTATQAQFDRLTKMLIALKLKGQSNERAFYQDILNKAAILDTNPQVVSKLAAKPTEIATLMIRTMKKTADRF